MGLACVPVTGLLFHHHAIFQIGVRAETQNNVAFRRSWFLVPCFCGCVHARGSQAVFPFAWNPLYQLINTGSLYALTELFFWWRWEFML